MRASQRPAVSRSFHRHAPQNRIRRSRRFSLSVPCHALLHPIALGFAVRLGDAFQPRTLDVARTFRDRRTTLQELSRGSKGDAFAHPKGYYKDCVSQRYVESKVPSRGDGSDLFVISKGFGSDRQRLSGGRRRRRAVRAELRSRSAHRRIRHGPRSAGRGERFAAGNGKWRYADRRRKRLSVFMPTEQGWVWIWRRHGLVRGQQV
jgi:hypothetical protein